MTKEFDQLSLNSPEFMSGTKECLITEEKSYHSLIAPSPL